MSGEHEKQRGARSIVRPFFVQPENDPTLGGRPKDDDPI
jgi:hypothetical protein